MTPHRTIDFKQIQGTGLKSQIYTAANISPRLSPETEILNLVVATQRSASSSQFVT